MNILRVALPALFAGCLLFSGCSAQPSQSSKASEPNPLVAKPTIIGKWTTSTAPEMAASATKATFLESGEYQVSGPLEIEGKTVEVEVDGKKQFALFLGSGTWDLKGDQLQVHVTTANLAGWKAEPWNYKVLELTDKKLVLEKDGVKVAYFRLE